MLRRRTYREKLTAKRKANVSSMRSFESWTNIKKVEALRAKRKRLQIDKWAPPIELHFQDSFEWIPNKKTSQPPKQSEL